MQQRKNSPYNPTLYNSRQLKASVAVDSILEFGSECGALVVDGQLEAIEACGGRWQPHDGVALTHRQEAAHHTAHLWQAAR